MNPIESKYRPFKFDRPAGNGDALDRVYTVEEAFSFCVFERAGQKRFDAKQRCMIDARNLA